MVSDQCQPVKKESQRDDLPLASSPGPPDCSRAARIRLLHVMHDEFVRIGACDGTCDCKICPMGFGLFSVCSGCVFVAVYRHRVSGLLEFHISRQSMNVEIFAAATEGERWSHWIARWLEFRMARRLKTVEEMRDLLAAGLVSRTPHRGQSPLVNVFYSQNFTGVSPLAIYAAEVHERQCGDSTVLRVFRPRERRSVG